MIWKGESYSASQLLSSVIIYNHFEIWSQGHSACLLESHLDKGHTSPSPRGGVPECGDKALEGDLEGLGCSLNILEGGQPGLLLQFQVIAAQAL